MAKQEPLGYELDLVKRALSDIFSVRIMAWQLGGTMVGALMFAVARWVAAAVSNSAVAFTLNGLGLVAAYVVVCATGTMVARLLSSDGKAEGGVAPLHFLVDNVSTATLVPLTASAGAVVLAAILCAPTALWRFGAGQAVLVLPAAVVFILVFLVIVALFLLLFVVPAMVVVEQPPLSFAFKRLLALVWGRTMDLVRIFSVGLIAAVLAAVPVLLAVFAARATCAWMYDLASGAELTPFAAFILNLFSMVLLWAPICAVLFAFLNAVSLRAYGTLVEGLAEEEELEELTPAGEEEIELEVPAKKAGPKARRPAKKEEAGA